MTTPRFDYPTAAAPTDSVVFTGASYSYPVGGEDRRIQAQEETAGGALIVYDKGAEVQTMDLTWPEDGAMPLATFTALRSFLRTVTLMGLRTFQLTDHAGTVTTVRVVGDSFAWRLVGHERYLVSLRLRAE
jgi:hypothetical protein